MSQEDFNHGVRVITIDDGPRPIRTARKSIIMIWGTAPNADATAFPLNEPVLVAGSRREAAKLDTVGTRLGTLPNAVDAIFDQIGAVVVVCRVAEGTNVDPALKFKETVVNIIGGTDPVTGRYTGIQAARAALAKLGYAPGIFIAPGFTHFRDDDPDSTDASVKLANPVVAEMLAVAEVMRAVILADGPGTNDADAIAYRKDWGSKRIQVCDPMVKVLRGVTYVNEWTSPRSAGLLAKSDNDRGFWWSHSNQVINGISGTSRAVDYTNGDISCRANLLNAQNVQTVIRLNGYRLWGNHTCADDEKWRFLCVVRTSDTIADSLELAHLWAVDRCINATYVNDVQESVTGFLRHLTNIGAILGGKCYVDPDVNGTDQIQLGKFRWDYEFTPCYPAEDMIFAEHVVSDYITTLFPSTTSGVPSTSFT